ncbi:hypothetical protein [Pedobacter boryungensis]|uniref:Uncharacterized protein n=1 Tax=Pedobacter boryungensis TaxID=869962 RepID=A0ABX2D9C4_9SPHI|nr:hypothetical protein [Pedobacter boryungensis]NQX30640.1 hypothetical protein [Pedobacter boryungensis]
MEPFNIHIQNNDEQVTLTVIPEKDYFKLVYFGGIIGAIKESEGEWELLEEDEIEPGLLPLFNYKNGVNNEELKFELSLPKINQIAAEIENAIY